MAFLLGIDGGGSGCRAAVADLSGTILGQAGGGPANIASDPDGARTNILAAAHQALDQAGVRDIAAVAAGMGLAGANAPGMAERLRAGLPFRRVRIESDAIAAVKGALQDNDGIVAAIGTGSVFASQRAGVIRQIGGWGLILGDEGSGAWLGRAALSAALGAAEGFVPLTPFADGLLGEFGGVPGIVAFSLTARPADFAAIAPKVIASDDPAARGIMDRAVADVAASADVLQKPGPLPVTFIGGLGQVYAGHLSGRWPLRPAMGTALDGALWLARGL